MSIMTCPKCAGSGLLVEDHTYGGQATSVAPYTTACSSCGGVGYVTDNMGGVTVNISVVLGHTPRLPVTNIKILS